MFLPPSSPIAYPPSSSPPALLARRKRSFPAEEQAGPQKRPLIRGNPLSLRDPNRQDGGDIWTDWQPPDLPESTSSKAPIKGPFIDDEDGNDDSRLSAHFMNDQGGPVKDNRSISPPATIRCPAKRIQARSSAGRSFQLKEKQTPAQIPFRQMLEERSSTEAGKATRCFYGVEIHNLLDKAAAASNAPVKNPETLALPRPSVERVLPLKDARSERTLMWTEKYRAKKFTDLVGDERTHRDVLRWVKHWDGIVFPGSSKPIPKSRSAADTTEDKTHCKILLLAGPPGLGKTTLAHVCARQAGYEVVEINASDERSRDVVRGKIRDLVGTENVRGVKTKTASGTVRRAGRPVCVVVDEVDGAVAGTSGGGGGEGGFVKALIDLVASDRKNSKVPGTDSDGKLPKRNRKGDYFRFLRPMILICNDVYHPTLRPLRSPGIAEIIHVRKPPMDKVTARIKFVFENEGIPCDSDGIRRLCEATWGVSSSRENRSTIPGTGEGDIRGLLVVGEWVAARLRAQELSSATRSPKLTRQWIQQYLLKDLSLNGSAARSLGRGGAREVMERIFQDNAGFPKESNSFPTDVGLPTKIGGSFGVSEAGKRIAVGRLRDLVEMSGECDRIMTECFASYATQPFQDDTLLSKPAAAYDWLQFHDSLSAKIYSGQEWELMPYLSQAALGFHLLFASAPKHSWITEQARLEEDGEAEPIPFTGPRADYEASETQKQNGAVLQAFRSYMSPPLQRSFRSPEDITTGLLPYLIRILTPDVKPVIVGGGGEQKGVVSVRKGEERKMIERAVGIMPDFGVTFERSIVDPVPGSGKDYVYRMEPPVDALTSFETAACGGPASSTTRYAIRQALDQEYRKIVVGHRAIMGQTRPGAGSNMPSNKLARIPKIDVPKSDHVKGSGRINAPKRDFFGRLVKDDEYVLERANGRRQSMNPNDRAHGEKRAGQIFVSFHEGYSNAVRKPITLDDLMRGL
ncbi:Chromosome transmission fidelity protein 18 [Xanthoria parietina]